MKKVVVVFMLLSISYFKAQINTLESSLVLQNGLYYQNNAPYTGYALSYYPQEQIKSICEIKEGQKTGRFTSYYYDNSFNKINFKDTSKINQYTLKKSVLKEQINQLIKDTVDSYGKMTSYLKDEIGGEKKLLKIQEKSAEGDLKGKKLEEFNTYNNYVNKHNSAIQLLKEQQLASQKNEEKLSSELSKKEFFGVSKEQYQQKNGVKDGSFISHFENGKTSSEGIYKEGKYNDLWTFYHENGNIKGKGIFQMGDGSDLGDTGLPRNGRDGQWLLYHENGKIDAESNWVDGKLKGSYKTYYANGKMKEESNFLNAEYDGKYTSWFENGNLKKECSYVDGKLKGVYKSYYANGKMEEEYNISNGKYDGKYTSWFENGKIKEEGTWVEGKANGNYKTFHENGNLKREGTYIAGKQNGLFKNYYENGNLKSELNLNDTLREGLCKYYYDNGKLKQEWNFKEDKANGVFKSYHENGNLRREGTYINGKQFGLFKNYFQTGLLSSELTLNDTIKDGLCKYYHENGKIKSEKTFKNDVLNGSYKTFYDNGKRDSEGFYKDDKAQGLFIQYDENGNKKQETNFVNGIVDGLMKLYYGNGKIDKQFIMKNGKAHGESKHYFESGVLKLSCTYDTLAKEKITGDTKLFDENGLLLEHSYYNLDGTAVDKLKKVSQSNNNNNSKNNSSNQQTTFNICDDGGKYINREITLTGFYSRYENDNRQLRDWTYEDLHSDLNYGFVKDNDVYYTREIKSNSGCQIILRIPKKLSYDKSIPNIDSGQYITINGILIKENIIQVIGITR
jgi:antitoxin component YwqK of YwqJK toxin-antitoxin module